MIENSYRAKFIFRVVTVAYTALVGALFSVLLINFFEPDILMYTHGVKINHALNIFVIIYVAVAFVFGFLVLPRSCGEVSENTENFKKFRKFYALESTGVKICSYVCGGILLGETIYKSIAIYMGDISVYINPLYGVINMLTGVFLSLYFFPEIFEKVFFGKENIHVYFGTLGVFWFLTNVFGSYFDMSIAVNSPYKLFHQIMSLALMLYFVYEIKMYTSSPAPRLRYIFLCLAFFMCVSFTVARIFMVMSGNIVPAGQLYYLVCEIGFSVYLTSKILFYREII